MEEQRTAVHFDGAWQQTAKVVDVPEEERWGSDVMREAAQEAMRGRGGNAEIYTSVSHLFWEGCREEETLSSQNFLIARVVRAWSALWTQPEVY